MLTVYNSNKSSDGQDDRGLALLGQELRILMFVLFSYLCVPLGMPLPPSVC